MRVDDLEHPLGRFILELRPAHQIIRAAAVLEAGRLQPVLAVGEDTPSDIALLAQADRLVFLQRLDLVDPLREKQIGNLFDVGERVGDTALP